MSWRNATFVLAAVCAVQTWRSCARSPAGDDDARPHGAECGDRSSTRVYANGEAPGDRDDSSAPPAEPANGGLAIAGVQVPSWAMWFAPRPDEDMRAYRDRVLPVVQAAIAPHRARVARGRDDFAAQVHLDAHQLGELDAAARDAASAIEERVLGAALSGDFMPATFKPMAGVEVARDVLDAVDRGNKRFLAAMTDDQRAQLAQHPFDFADYLLFGTRWEDALGLVN